MKAPAIDILPSLRGVVVDESAVTDKLGKFNDEPSVHTRRPVPAEAKYPMVVIGPIITRGNEDGINSFRPILVIDVTIYGEQPAGYRDVELIAETIYGLFHMQRHAFTVPNYSVVNVTATGPTPAPVKAGPGDDESRVGRRVTLTIRLYAPNR